MQGAVEFSSIVREFVIDSTDTVRSRSNALDFLDVLVRWPTTIVEKYVPNVGFFLNAPDQLAE